MLLFQEILVYATVLVHVSWILGLLGYIVYKSPLKSRFVDEKISYINEILTNFYQEISLFLVSAATAGSLYFSEIIGFEPCPLCWYQRIFMYPLVIITGISVILLKEDVEDYVMPVSLIGIGISGYHYMVQTIGSLQAGCAEGVSCEAQHVLGLDYISIPLMAFTVFVTVFVLNWKFSE